MKKKVVFTLIGRQCHTLLSTGNLLVVFKNLDKNFTATDL